jgi:hypothetical protein
MDYYFYCLKSDPEIAQEINRVSIPVEAMVTSCCWERICEARANNPHQVNEAAWSQLNQVRGRGFSNGYSYRRVPCARLSRE